MLPRRRKCSSSSYCHVVATNLLHPRWRWPTWWDVPSSVSAAYVLSAPVLPQNLRAEVQQSPPFCLILCSFVRYLQSKGMVHNIILGYLTKNSPSSLFIPQEISLSTERKRRNNALFVGGCMYLFRGVEWPFFMHLGSLKNIFF